MAPAERFEVTGALDGERLDRAVALVTGRPRSAVRALVADGAVLLDGVPTTVASTRLSVGAVVHIAAIAKPTMAADTAAAPVPEETVDVDVVYTDNDVVVVNKPAGVVTHPGAGHPTGTLADALVQRFPEMTETGPPDRRGIVHRLDRGTSGLLVCARNSAAYDALVAQLASREITRIYLALVRGMPESVRGTIDAPIGRDRHHRTMMTVLSDGRPARTHFALVESFSHPVDASLLRCALETGRTHQIRVHLASIGLPLLGDLAYGVPDPFGIGRPLLHATRLEFRHPSTDEAMSFEAELSPDFAEAIRQFGGDPATITVT
ncbi:RluA family pseudouridine synthase [Candidatus Poriferisodalis sp.]|uniref:RluA family pseudouridine synthase n=1 Tax=Candidatus Poriferisodalis sp. TaxID=3101277 RepID=UPI003B022CCC